MIQKWDYGNTCSYGNNKDPGKTILNFYLFEKNALTIFTYNDCDLLLPL